MKTYELLEDVPRGIKTVQSRDGRVTVTLGPDARWHRLDNGQVVPLDAGGHWFAIEVSA